MKIPERAVEAAAAVLYAEARNASADFDQWPDWHDVTILAREAFLSDARNALTAAAPFIAAQTLRDYTTGTEGKRVRKRTSYGYCEETVYARDSLLRSAEELDPL